MRFLSNSEDITRHSVDAKSPAFTKSLLHFIKLHGRDVNERCLPYHEWADERRAVGVWPYAKVLMGRVGESAAVANEFAGQTGQCINFGSQDYLGLASRVELQDALREGVKEWGVHSAGSPVLCGRTRILAELEDKIRTLLRRPECIIFPTGWAAGFGVLAGLVRGEDSVVMDALSHNCLQEGARHATSHIRHFAHNDLDMMNALLKVERERNPGGGLFVVLESLYSMDSDSPDLRAAIRMAREHEAIVILDVAHDFGALGETGLGLLETVRGEDGPDVIMGSFSKTFAANGGFIACSPAVREYLAFHSSPHIFSNAISPLQTLVISRAFDLVFSEEGVRLRAALMGNIQALREAMRSGGFTVSGIPSPIVPVFVGDEKIARLTSKHLTRNGLLANLVEFPAVARGKARFRFQVMATHGREAIHHAAEIMLTSQQAAEADLHGFAQAKESDPILTR